MKKSPTGTLEELKQLEFPLQALMYVGYAEHFPDWKGERDANFDALYYIRSGKMSFTIDGSTYLCEQNSLTYRERTEHATVRNASHTEACALYTILFHFKSGISFRKLGIPRIIRDEPTRLLDLIRKLYITHIGQGAAYRIKEFSEFSELLYEIVTHKLNTDKAFLVDRKISIAMQYVRRHYNKAITVEDLSQMVGYSPSHFRRLFVKCCGMSPQTYLLNCKIDIAKTFLLERTKDVSEIAEELNFCSASYFCRIFKEKTGLTPHQFQKQAEEGTTGEIFDY